MAVGGVRFMRAICSQSPFMFSAGAVRRMVGAAAAAVASSRLAAARIGAIPQRPAEA